MNEQKTFRSGTFNINMGGFSSCDTAEASPPREQNILEAINDASLSALTLVDTFRWDTQYGGNEGIAQHLGMDAAFYTPFNDDRLKVGNPNASEMGIVFATNERVALSEPIDFATRQANRTVLDIGKYGLQVVSLYADHADEDVRSRQFRALDAQLEAMPTLLQGDFNTLRLLKNARWSEKARSAIIRLAGLVLPDKSSIAVELHELERREALGVLLDAGFKDNDPKQRPTALGRIKLFGVDYMLSRGDGVTVSNVDVLSHKGASDHRMLVGDVTVDN